MMKKIFIGLGVIGTIVICILSFIIPDDPYISMPSAMGWEKPLWLGITMVGSFVYISILTIIYNHFQ